MPIPVFYDEAQNATDDLPSPSAGKPRYVVRSWLDEGLPIEVRGFSPVTPKDLCRVHERKYVESVLSLREANGFGTFSAEVARSLLWTSGSFVAAAEHAWTTGLVACSPTSGFHHAEYAGGGGYCTFNGLMVAAERLIRGGVNRVGVLDCDAHYGNGTADILQCVGRLEDRVEHFTRGHPDYGVNAKRFLDSLEGLLGDWSVEGVELVLYQAGADPHVDDPLGGMLTTEELRERDRIVFSTCQKLGLPIAWNLAGGYQERRAAAGAERLRPVLDIHDNTMRECVRAFTESELRRV
jgi:acetoin utilization deacetylase AcuC-like enzyme